MEKNLKDIIAEYISTEYEFHNHDGEQYGSDGYDEAESFIRDIILPQVDTYIIEYFSARKKEGDNH